MIKRHCNLWTLLKQFSQFIYHELQSCLLAQDCCRTDDGATRPASYGRKLRPGEVVHHLDGDRTNNSPENLVVCSSASVHPVSSPVWEAENGTRSTG